MMTDAQKAAEELRRKVIEAQSEILGVLTSLERDTGCSVSLAPGSGGKLPAGQRSPITVVVDLGERQS